MLFGGHVLSPLSSVLRGPDASKIDIAISPKRQWEANALALALLDTGFLWLREVACLLVRLNHLARLIVNADHGIM
jgi:hypothetical protein